ncbi:MAG: hypothetical protein ABIQ16_25690 [Polyangiaceae bacterium]
MKNVSLISTSTLCLAVMACSNAADPLPPAGGAAGAGTAGSTQMSTAGSDSTGTAGSGTAGSGTAGSGDSGGGAPSGGSNSAGSSNGGSNQTGGSGGSGGSIAPAGGNGGAGAAGGGNTPTITITSTDFGDFANSFLLTPCQDGGNGYDCLNNAVTNNCPTAAWKYDDVQTTEATGNTYEEVFTVSGGDASKVYEVTVHVLGQVEGRTYTNGTRKLTTAVDPGAPVSDLLYTGGKPGTGRVDYNVFQLTVTGGTPITGQPSYFAFNAVDQTHEGEHHNYAVDETFSFQVKSGMTVKLTAHDSNCRAIMNCGTQASPYGFGTGAACIANARSTPASVTLPAKFRGVAVANPGKFQTQFLNFKVTGIVAK